VESLQYHNSPITIYGNLALMTSERRCTSKLAKLCGTDRTVAPCHSSPHNSLPSLMTLCTRRLAVAVALEAGGNPQGTSIIGSLDNLPTELAIQLLSLLIHGGYATVPVYRQLLREDYHELDLHGLAHLPLGMDGVLLASLLRQHCPRVRVLNMADSPGVFTDLEVRLLAAGQCELRDVRLRGLPLTDDSLADIVSSCPRLTSLDLRGCSELTDAGFEVFAELGAAAPPIRTLSLAFLPELTADGLEWVAVGVGETLEELSLKW